MTSTVLGILLSNKGPAIEVLIFVKDPISVYGIHSA